MEICQAFKLNIDQEIVLNEVTKWFLPKKESSSQSEANDESLIDGLSDAS